MKKSKKIVRPVVAAVMSVVTAGLFTACGGGGKTPFEWPEETTVTSTNESSYKSLQDLLDDSADVNRQIAEGGYVLLKNNNSALPFASSVKKVSLFGRNSMDPVYSGSGSSGGTQGQTIDIKTSLENAGYEVNPKLAEFYNGCDKRSGIAHHGAYAFTGEAAQSEYPADVKSSYDQYNDAAVIVISRTGGEGQDLPTVSYADSEGQKTTQKTLPEAGTNVSALKGGYGRESDPTQHFLELDDNEKALINAVTAKFDKVVLILNSVTSFELDRQLLVNNDKVQSIIWAPGAGPGGFNALGKMLNGTLNPSGRLTDTFAADFKSNPAIKDFADNEVYRGNAYLNTDGTEHKTSFWAGNPASDGMVFGNQYTEGIYMGYKYYETRGYTDGDTWYNSNVNYPFGYGLSYTSFDWKVGKVALSTDTLTAKTKIGVEVEVKNTGSVAGRDVVQLYFSAPYTNGKTEKSHVVLGAFEKTELLKPNETQKVKLVFDAFDMASFDTYDKDGDGHKGYELDKGEYNIYIGTDAHSAWKNGNAKKKTKQTIKLAADVNIDKDPTTDADIALRFDDCNEEMKNKTLSRADWEGTFPKTPTVDDRKRSAEWLKGFDLPVTEDSTAANAIVDPEWDKDKPWYSATAPAFAAEEKTGEEAGIIKLPDLVGVAYDDPKWDAFLSQFTVDEAYSVVQGHMFCFQGFDKFGVPNAGNSDGPTGLNGSWVGGGDNVVKPMTSGDYKICFAPETLVACTWDKDLAYQQGLMFGEYGLWMHVAGWLGPAANMHRNPFGGRNFEYYSEDATLSGAIVSNVIAAARSKGIVTYMKHFALNDQETSREDNLVASWADEQTIRENYLKPFEWAVKKGKSNGAMTSFNRIGFTWAGANYGLLTGIFRNEWGFMGHTLTDAHQSGNGAMFTAQMIRCGTDMTLDGRANSISQIANNAEQNTPTHLTALWNSCKHILYTEANSSAMYYTKGNTVTYDAVKNTTVSAAKGGTVSLSVSDGSDGSEYIIFVGRLPDGLKLENGVITGTIASDAKAGDYKVKVVKLLPNATDKTYYNNSIQTNLKGSIEFTVTVTE